MEDVDALRRRVELMQKAERVAHVGSWEWDIASDTVTWSDELFRIFKLPPGVSAPSFTEHPKYYTPEGMDLLRRAVEGAVRDGTPYVLELTAVCVDGELKTCIVRGNAELGADGKPVRLFGSLQDITEQKRYADNLHKIAWMLEKEAQPSVMGQTSTYGDVTELNSERVIRDGVGLELLQTMATDVMALLDTSIAVYEKNGDYAYGLFVSDWCHIMDEASRKLCGTTDNRTALSCGKWLCHENCWNDSAKTAMATGTPTDIKCVGGIRLYAVPIRAGHEIIGVINIGYGNPPTDEETLAHLAETFHVDIQRLTRAALAFKARPKFIIDAAKSRLHSIAITIGQMVERKRIEQALRAAKEEAEAANRAKSFFLSNMSHELRTPLNPVIGFSDFLLAQGNLNPQQQQAIEVIYQRSRDLLQLINDILDMTRIETNRFPIQYQEVDVRALIADTASIFEQQALKKGIRLSALPDSELERHLWLDPMRLRQVLMNLIGNAIKFTDGGAVEVRAALKSGTEEVLRVTIRDTGIGIAPEHQELIFEPLQQVDTTDTRKYEGAGLGLAIAKRLVELMGGMLHVESVLHKGSTFILELPSMSHAHGDGPSARAGDNAPSDASARKRHVLLVEDDPASMLLAQTLLNRAHCTMTCVTNGQMALKAVAEHHFDLILMDVKLPGMNGFSVTRALREQGVAVPIIGVTAYAFESDRKQGLEAGMNEWITKPLEINRLDEVISRLCP
ncbi:MAG: response regulator [Spartobacteria bacterium]|nr:response regulator [Spartobacteria bacterium]